jgi:transcriptional regulator with XRE-family HTH domain
MSNVENDVERLLTLLRNKIRERGFTQMQIQDALQWGRSYISQILTRQKNIRVEQALRILEVIGVEPRDFFAELFRFAPYDGQAAPVAISAEPKAHEVRSHVLELQDTVDRLTEILLEKNLLSESDMVDLERSRNRLVLPKVKN